MDRRRGIGKNNQLPWHLPADLAHFKTLTMGKPIVMGRKTYESIGRILPGRHTIILTRDPHYQIEGADIFHDLFAVLNHFKGAPEIMIIGGEAVFQEALNYATDLYFTQIEGEFEADIFFPQWNEKEWKKLSEEVHSADRKNAYAHRFVHYER